VVPFDKGLQDVVGSKPEKRRENMMALKNEKI